MFGAKVVERGLTLVKLIVLARLLSPDDFGLFGIVVLAISTLEMLSRPGMRRALIRRRETGRNYLDSAWTFLFLRGLFLGGLMLVAAGPISAFFEMSAAAPLLRAMAALAVLRGLQNIGTVFFEKNLQFSRRFALETGAALIGLVTGVVLAIQMRSAWALVLSSLSAEGARTGLSYLLHPYRPRFELKRKEAGQLVSFGKWLFGSSTVLFIATNADDAVVGKVLGSASLGIYQIAFRISHMPLTEFGKTVFRVLYPAYAKIYDQR
jgi:O-antigen/teichoic acid export membrane protein